MERLDFIVRQVKRMAVFSKQPDYLALYLNAVHLYDKAHKGDVLNVVKTHYTPKGIKVVKEKQLVPFKQIQKDFYICK